MAPVIRIDEEVWAWLKTRARPLEDTPNTVLRRLAGIDPPLKPPAAEPMAKLHAPARAHYVMLDDDAGDASPASDHPAPPGTKRVTGEWLNRAFKIGARHALYSKHGTVYEQLTQFPGILCDAGGYVHYDDEAQFTGDERLSIGEKVNVPGGLASHPRYERFPAAKESMREGRM